MLTAGTTLGPYRILAPLGAGGMGEVYRARDTRLNRDVAIKVIPDALAREPERLKRFEQEARAAGALNHPNVCTLHDVGTHEGAPYVVMELLEGESLRERLAAGPLPIRKAVEYAAQVALGLAAAHAKGIVHRDLKPANLFVTKDGRVKVLDFGLAKLTRPEVLRSGDATLSVAGTETGAVLGTAGYMAPEQVRGEAADARTDLFALGAVIYEMVSGRRAFGGATFVETGHAILNLEPEGLAALRPDVPAGLESLVRRCLEKAPAQRFQSASDLAYALEAMGGGSGESRTVAMQPARAASKPAATLAAIALVAALGVTGGYLLWGRGRPSGEPPVFQGLTFHRGTVLEARFIPGDRSILFSASWEGNANHVYSLIPGSPESRMVIPDSASVLAVSGNGDMALMLRPRRLNPLEIAGTLAQAPFGGGAPRAIMDEVTAADWSPDGSSLLVVRLVAGQEQLEYPAGKVLYRTRGWISDPRISPRGDLIAFLAHPRVGDDVATVTIIDLLGRTRSTSQPWGFALGLAWAPGGREVWFSAADGAAGQAIHAMTLEGRHRLVLRQAGSLLLHDIAADGAVLLSRIDSGMGLVSLDPATGKERDLSWFDWSLATDLTPDGRSVVFTEMGTGVGNVNTVYSRGTDGTAAVRLGEGWGASLSRDGRWVLAIASMGTTLVAHPTGPGSTRTLERGAVREYLWACWFPDCRRVLFCGVDTLGAGARLYIQNAEGGPPTVADSLDVGGGYFWNSVSPDGSRAVFPGSHGLFTIRSFGTTTAGIATLRDGDSPIGWSADSRSLFVGGPSEREATVERVDLASGVRTPWLTIRPADPAGLVHIGPIRLSADGRTYAYNYLRTLSDLYVVKGLK